MKAFGGYPQRLPQPRRPPLPAATGSRKGASARGSASTCAPCGWRVAAGFHRGGGSLAPMRSKETPKTGHHGGIIHQPQRNCSIPKAYAKQHLLGEGHRALRAPPSRRAACRSQGLPHAALLLRAPPCRVLAAAADFPCGGGSLAPMRSKKAPKTGDHGGIMR